MFGISLTELLVVLVVGLVVLGPDRLPTVMRTLGQWIGKVRRLSSEMRAQSGIDELLRKEGFAGGLSELRQLLRRDLSSIGQPIPSPSHHQVDFDPYTEPTEMDLSREQPPEGPDAYGAIPDDLIDDRGPSSSPVQP